MSDFRGLRIKRERIVVNDEEIQRIVSLLELHGPYATRIRLFESVAQKYNAEHPELGGKVTSSLIRVRFDPVRSPNTILTCITQ